MVRIIECKTKNKKMREDSEIYKNKDQLPFLATVLIFLFTHPSEKSACNRLKYVSHSFPITFPQVKHRTGIIIIILR